MTLNPFDTGGFPPRWNCGPTWAEEPVWGWLHIVADVAIWLAYLTIPITCLYVVKRRDDVPVRGLVFLFAAFVLACGFTHLVEAAIFWWPAYRLSAYLKVITAAVSVLTAIALARSIPLLLAIKSPNQLSEEIAELTSRYEAAEIAPDDAESETSEVARLTLERAQLRLALEGGRMGAWHWNIQTDEVSFSEEQLQLVGFTAEELPNAAAFFEHIHPKDAEKVRKSIQKTIETQSVYREEFRFRYAGKSYIWLGGRGKVLCDDKGTPIAIVGVNWDISEEHRSRNELAKQRRRAEAASEAKSEFLANVSHEIRTPLAAILGCADLLYPSVKEGESRDYLQTIRRQGALLHSLLNDVLDLSKIEAGQLEIQEDVCDVRRIVADVASLMRPLASQKGLELHTDVTADVPRAVVTDPLRIRQVLVNLTSNAIKFTESGSVDVSIDASEDSGKVTSLALTVSDTGPGIAPDRLKAIFEPFEQADGTITRRYGGTGLGLSISENLIRLMNGSMEVESNVGSGTTFDIRIPIEITDEEPPTAAPIDEPPPNFGRLPIRVLVAEDTDTLQFLIEKLIGPHVEHIHIVDNGQKAIDEMHRTQNTDDAYDAVLMDVQMPILDGLEATRQLRADGIKTPIFALTAAAMPDDQQRSIDAGCNGHLAKPIDKAVVYKALEAVASNGAQREP